MAHVVTELRIYFVVELRSFTKRRELRRSDGTVCFDRAYCFLKRRRCHSRVQEGRRRREGGVNSIEWFLESRELLYPLTACGYSSLF